jgi:type IV pilus assembly protein PilC
MSEMRSEDLQALNDEIAGLAKAGLPLDKGLEALARDLGRGKLADVTREISENLRKGKSLSEAFDSQGSAVPAYYGALIASGVRTGRMADVLATLTLHARTLSDLKSTIWLSLVYPFMVISGALALVVFMTLFLVPQFATIFKDFGMRVPAFTAFLLFIGEEPLTRLLLPLAFVAGIILTSAYLIWTSGPGSRFLTNVLYTIPGVGGLVRSVRLAAFSDLMGILLENNIPFPEALRLAGEASSDPLLRDAAIASQAKIAHGESFSKVMREQDGFPEMLSWIAGWAERRGELPRSFHQAAKFYQRRAETQSILLRGILPTMGIILTGIVVGGLVIGGLLSPLFYLLETLSK